MKMSIRGWVVVGAFTAILVVTVFGNPWASAAETATKSRPTGQLSEKEVGNLLAAMGLEAKNSDRRFDFDFKAVHQKEEWELSMSTVLSENGEWIWVMAWLDALPKSAVDVPRTALLRMLSDNDRMGNGKFFAYIASNRRFVLQRVIPNRNLGTANFRAVLQDLGASVVQTHPHWNIENWKRKAPTQSTVSAPKGSQSAGAIKNPKRVPVQSAVNESKFKGSTKK